MGPAKFITFTLSGCLLSTSIFISSAWAASLPDISPEQIRQDMERRYNSQTGAAEWVAPSFDPFELDDTLAGSAALRSAGQAVTLDGRTVAGGAFLDLSLFYTTDSNDAYDIRGVERGAYVSGQPVDAVRYDNKILDCSENVREVVYDDGYYAGSPYGYLAGVYRRYPRYRGHRGFGHHRGYGQRNSYRGRHRTGNRTRHTNYNDGFRDGRAGHTGRGDRRERNRDRASDERRDTSNVRTSSGTLVTIPGSAISNNNRDHTPRGLSAKERRHLENRRTSRHSLKDPNRNVAGSSGGKDGQARPSTSRDQDSRTRRTVKTPSPERVRPMPARTDKAPKTFKAPDRDRVRPSSTRKDRSRTNRAVDRQFGRKNKRSQGLTRQKLNFYPAQFRPLARSNVSVTYRCAREEMLTLHIPQERLDAARFDGFTVLLLDREDREIPVYVPPNYIEGFRKALSGTVNYAPQRTSSTPMASSYEYVPSSSDHSLNGGDKNAPIIYGNSGQ